MVKCDRRLSEKRQSLTPERHATRERSQAHRAAGVREGASMATIQPVTGSSAPTTTLIDEAMPHYDVRTRHTIWVPTDVVTAYAALKAITWKEVRLIQPLMILRGLAGSGKANQEPSDLEQEAMPIFGGGTADGGFLTLGERPDTETLIGTIGRFWESDPTASMRVGGSSIRTRDEFAAFCAPGYAKCAMSFAARPHDTGTVLVIETRVAGTDAEATRRFRRYWAALRIGEALLSRSMLAAVRRRIAREASERPVGLESATRSNAWSRPEMAVTLSASILAGVIAALAQRGGSRDRRITRTRVLFAAGIPWAVLVGWRTWRQGRP